MGFFALRLGHRHHCRSRLSSLEKELKNTVGDQAAELETVERRLVDTTEALRSQKNLRMKEMLENQVGRGPLVQNRCKNVAHGLVVLVCQSIDDCP